MRLERLAPLEDERTLLAAQRLADLMERPQMLLQLAAACRLLGANRAVVAVVHIVLLVLATPAWPLDDLRVSSA